MLSEAGIVAIGFDPTLALIEEARRRDQQATTASAGSSTAARTRKLRPGRREMARVLRPGGNLLIANLTSHPPTGNLRRAVESCFVDNGGNGHKDADGLDSVVRMA
jgi:hypothetical protein